MKVNYTYQSLKCTFQKETENLMVRLFLLVPNLETLIVLVGVINPAAGHNQGFVEG